MQPALHKANMTMLLHRLWQMNELDHTGVWYFPWTRSDATDTAQNTMHREEQKDSDSQAQRPPVEPAPSPSPPVAEAPPPVAQTPPPVANEVIFVENVKQKLFVFFLSIQTTKDARDVRTSYLRG